MNVDIYQTLEDKGNYDEVERHGPYFCSIKNEDGSIKRGTKEPWLGEGYYFWDTRKDDAHWWGETVYYTNMRGYIICHTTYDQCSPLLFDLVGNMAHMDEFEECASHVKRIERKARVSVPYVLEVLKKTENFGYKAVRACPITKIDRFNTRSTIYFPGDKAIMKGFRKVQICFFDMTLLREPFEICDRCPIPSNFTI